MKKVGVWLRVSTDIQAKSDSPEHHEERARAYALAKDWKVATVYHLEAVSGKDVLSHPEAQRMLEDISLGRITGIIFSKIARLARNVTQLLEISKTFQKYNADLISLEESVDTSSPAGRFFFTLISAMAEWEREEISARVKASVGVRAKLGKPLGGQAPYGYKYVDKELVLDKKESAVRKLMFELFLKHKRYQQVCDHLNNRGYRTRRGSKFTITTVRRLLEDPIAKGLRKVNYTEVEGKSWKIKDEEEWEFHHVPRIVSDRLWKDVNDIITKNAEKNKRPTNTRTNLFTGYAFCDCGGKMYVRTKSPRYICQKCKRKIKPEELEEIYYTSLADYLKNEIALKNLNADLLKNIEQEKLLLENLKSRAEKLDARMNSLLDLNSTGEIPSEGFSKRYTPLFEEHEQILQSIEDKEHELNISEEKMKLNENVIDGATKLYQSWKSLSKTDKRDLIERVTKKIIIGKSQIQIKLAGRLPRQRNGYKMGNESTGVHTGNEHKG